MSRQSNTRLLVSAAVVSLAIPWWGCSGTSQMQTTTGTMTTTALGGTGGTGTGGAGTGGDLPIDGGVGGGEEAGACVSKNESAHRVPLDIVFLIDRSGSMTGPKWMGTTSALSDFFNDPASKGIGAGLVYFPAIKGSSCVPDSYQVLDVPIDVLPQNAFALINSMPADAEGYGTPTFAALKGALMAATAHQDANPTHKVILVVATDGDPFACGIAPIDDIADLAKSARNYNGVLTYVIGVEGSTIGNLNKIAAAGGTGSAYDITTDIGLFAAKVAEIRKVALGCEFSIPPPPNSMQLDPNQVNFSYTPKGVGMPKILPRADDLADCNGQPGWYYDDNNAPTEIILCPASCSTVQADSDAEVEVRFGCKSIPN